MGAGRPPDGLQHVKRLSGPREEKKRLRWIFASMMNECTVREACEALGIGAARFHQLRNRALAGALHGLSPGESGRPRRPEPTIDPAHVEKLERQVQQLKLDLEATRVRAELRYLAGRSSQKNRIKRK